MTFRRSIILVRVALGLMTLASPSLAEPATGAVFAEPSEPRLPIEEAQRPLTLPRFVLDPTANLELTRLEANDAYGNLTGSLSFGITDDLVLRALVLPLQLAGPGESAFHYGQTSGTRGPSIGATYRVVRGSFEVGLGLDLRVFTAANITGGAIIPTVPMRIHVGEHLRIDTAVTVQITRATTTASGTTTIVNPGGDNDIETTTSVATGDNTNSLRIPISALYNVTPSLYLGVTSGVTIDRIKHPDTSTGVPLGVFAGYTLAGKSGPVLDVEPFFTFPYFVTSGANSPTNTGEYLVGLNVRAFLYL